MVTRPLEPVLVPIGQPLGTIFRDDSATPQFRVRVADSIYSLSPPQALLWEVAHTTAPGRITNHTRLELFEVLREPLEASDDEIDEVMENMLDLEVLCELPIEREAMVEFSRAYRMMTLLHGLGNAPDRMDAFGFGLGADGFALAGILESELMMLAPAFGTLHDACVFLAEAVGASPATAHLGTPDALAGHVVGSIAPYLHTHTVCFDLAWAEGQAEAS